MASVGAGFEHVVKITNFFVDMAHLPAFFEVRDRYVNTKAPPASTAIQIGRLAREGALFEIEAVAVIPDRAAKAVRAKRGTARQARKTARRRQSAKRGANDCVHANRAQSRDAKLRLCPRLPQAGSHLTYVGWTTDVARRLAQHNAGIGARTTRGRAWMLLHTEKFRTRRQAMSREWYLKRDRKFRKRLSQAV